MGDLSGTIVAALINDHYQNTGQQASPKAARYKTVCRFTAIQNVGDAFVRKRTASKRGYDSMSMQGFLETALHWGPHLTTPSFSYNLVKRLLL